MATGLENATHLYLEGIRDGRIREALEKYIGERYTQHSAGVEDGREGFIKFFEPFMARYPERDIRIVRGIQEGSAVFLHAYQSLNKGASKWVTCDFFDTNTSGLIVEHWDVIAAHRETLAWGGDILEGPTHIEDTEHTQENKRCVARLINESIVTQTQNDKGFTYLGLRHIVASGWFVAVYMSAKKDGKLWALSSVFVVQKGRILHNWCVGEPLSVPDVNCGKF